MLILVLNLVKHRLLCSPGFRVEENFHSLRVELILAYPGYLPLVCPVEAQLWFVLPGSICKYANL